jgi:2-phospho-L-lactate guanylyltransferase
MWAIVPVKPLRRGKSRLSGVLNEDERSELNITLLGHTLEVLQQVKEISNTLVVSRDHAALTIARDMGARTVQEDGAPLLNTALKRATVIAQVYASSSVLIIPADLPLMQPSDIQTLISMAIDPPVVVIAPDRHGAGTNALLLNPAGLLEYSFGPGSFQKHCEKARLIGARLEICTLPSLELDLDLPEDLEILRKLEMDIPGFHVTKQTF